MKVSAKDKVEKTAEDHHEEAEIKGSQSWDDVTGEELDTAEVMKARAKEMGYIHEKRSLGKDEPKESRSLRVQADKDEVDRHKQRRRK